MKKETALLFLILLSGFSLRFAGSSFGLPHLYHADEPIIVNHALAYGTGDLNPHFFKIPPLISYLLFGVYGLFYLIGHLVGKFPTPQTFELFFYADPSIFYFLARLIFGVLTGTATVLVFYRLIARHFPPKTALVSAALLAVTFLHVSDSHYVYADIPLLLVITASFFAFFKVLDQPGLKPHIWSGVMIGLAAAIKYNGAVLAIPYVFLAFQNRKPKQALSLIFIAATVSTIVFFCLNPFSVFDFSTFVTELHEQAQHNINKDLSSVGVLVLFLKEGIGGSLLFFGLLGFLRLLGVWDIKKMAFGLWMLAYYLILVFGAQPYPRYVLPLIPFLIFFAADLISWLGERHHKIRPILAVACFLFAFVPNLLKSVMFDRLMLASDTRTLAGEWVLQNIPSGTGLALDQDFYMPRLSFSKEKLEEKKKTLDKNPDYFSSARARRLDFLLIENQEPGYDLNFFSLDPAKDSPSFFAQPLVTYDLKELRARSISYVFIQGVDHPSGPKDFYDQLKNESIKVAEFSPYHDKDYRFPQEWLNLTTWQLTGGPFKWEEIVNRERNGPRIEIYKIQ